jgi:hypothetical protein
MRFHKAENWEGFALTLVRLSVAIDTRSLTTNDPKGTHEKHSSKLRYDFTTPFKRLR